MHIGAWFTTAVVGIIALGALAPAGKNPVHSQSVAACPKIVPTKTIRKNCPDDITCEEMQLTIVQEASDAVQRACGAGCKCEGISLILEFLRRDPRHGSRGGTISGTAGCPAVGKGGCVPDP